MPGERLAAQRTAIAASAGAVLWLAREAPPGAEALFGRGARAALGRDFDTVVVDLHDGLDPDALGAVVGTVRAGGLLILVMPEADSLAEGPLRERLAVEPFGVEEVGRRFADRFVASLEHAAGVVTLGAAAEWVLGDEESERAPAPIAGADGSLSQDQRASVEALIAAPAGSPVVLVSDRGRGKSSALGLAAAALLAREPGLTVVVTGPGEASAGPVFARAAERGAPMERLTFESPSVLLDAPRPADLLLVDEAAALPVPVLERLLRGHPRVAFATTVHGYEGTGRGFAVRFRALLDRRRRGWRELRLREPIRWAPGDPVEAWAFDALMLAAEPAREEAVAAVAPEDCEVVRYDRAALAASEVELGELFGLLVLAHYRTSPWDLRRLLDAPNLTTFALRSGGHVVAAAVVAQEGGMSTETAEAVLTGRLRPRGHMLPEVLAAQLGHAAGATLLSARIVRIAVHPAARGRGLGTLLTNAVAADARARGASLLGSGFGVTAPLLRFWSRSGLGPVRLGLLRGASSGVRSAIVLGGLDDAGEELVASAQARFDEQLPAQLADPLRDLDDEVALHLLCRSGAAAPSLSAADWADLHAAAFGSRVSDAVVGPVAELVRTALSDTAARALLTEQQRRLLLWRVMQRRRWGEVATLLGVPSRQSAMRSLRAALAVLVLHFGGHDARAARQRYGRAAEADDGA